MRKIVNYVTLSAILLFLLAGLAPGAVRSQASALRQERERPGQVPTDQLIIKYLESARLALAGAAQLDELSRLSGVAGVELAYFRPMSGEAHVLKLPARLPEAQVAAIAARLAALPEVAYAEPDAIMQPLATTPNDPQYPSQWHYQAPTPGTYGINAPAAWDVTTGAASVVVAVIDTGITNHADLSGRTVPGYDFIINTFVSNDGDGRDSDPTDPGDWIATNDCYPGSGAYNSSWHGTHVAGTIGAATDNNLGVAGINWNSMILPVRVLGKCGGYLSDIAEGMRWAAGLTVFGVPDNPNPAKVLNLSLGGTGACDSTYQNAINDIVAAGSTVVVAAGNSNTDAVNFRPANCNQVITVAATDRVGDKAYYSNFGAVVEISAPGGDTKTAPIPTNGVLSTLNTGTQGPAAESYAFYQGTSMAAPHVAGVASLLYSLNPALTPTQVTHILTTTATAFPGGSTCNISSCGMGILNAANAVNGIPTEFVYLPMVVKHNPSPTMGINGTVTLNGSPIPGVSLDLRFYNGSDWSTQATTTTGADGSYSFTGVPSLTTGQKYYVLYLNDEDAPGHLWEWDTRVLNSYTAGSEVAIGDFDLADIPLVSPANYASITLPQTFQWVPRPATPSDSYEFNLYDWTDFDPYFYTDPPLGYVSSYNLSSLPNNFVDDLYAWEIWVYSPDGGLGLSYERRYVDYTTPNLNLAAPYPP
ncbi:MAG: S8 family serine peptidase, partial [Anaerolineales bacterium]